MARRMKVGVCLIVLVGAVLVAWWIFWDPEGTAGRVADLLENKSCGGVTTQTIRVPEVGLTHVYRQDRFADQATEFKKIECGPDPLDGGSIDFFRFSSSAVRVRAVARYPELHLHQLEAPFAGRVYAGLTFCVSGAEVLVDELLLEPNQDPTVAICHSLGFRVYNWPKRGP